MELQGRSWYVKLSFMAVHPCARFSNNPDIVHELTIICIAKYLSRTYTNTDLTDGIHLHNYLTVPIKSGLGKLMNTKMHPEAWLVVVFFNMEDQERF